jgi:hypothetical protein
MNSHPVKKLGWNKPFTLIRAYHGWYNRIE